MGVDAMLEFADWADLPIKVSGERVQGVMIATMQQHILQQEMLVKAVGS